MGTLHEDPCTFMIVSHQILPKIISVLGKSGRENQNTHFIFNDFFPEIVLVICDNVRKYIEPDTHSEYIKLIAFPREQWLCKCASMLHYTYIVYLVNV